MPHAALRPISPPVANLRRLIADKLYNEVAEPTALSAGYSYKANVKTATGTGSCEIERASNRNTHEE